MREGHVQTVKPRGNLCFTLVVYYSFVRVWRSISLWDDRLLMAISVEYGKDGCVLGKFTEPPPYPPKVRTNLTRISL